VTSRISSVLRGIGLRPQVFGVGARVFLPEKLDIMFSFRHAAAAKEFK
jgi:hypothetical protein